MTPRAVKGRWAEAASVIVSALICTHLSGSEQATPDKPLASISATAMSSAPVDDQTIDGPPRETIDLTLDGAVVHGAVAPRVIDTRNFNPQIDLNPRHSVGPLRLLPHEGRLIPPKPVLELSQTVPIGSVGPDPLKTRSFGFDGIDRGATNPSPPDPTIAVGPQHVLTTVKLQVAWYSKSGTLDDLQDLSAFFPSATEETFDPKCFYDHVARRFVIILLERKREPPGLGSWINIAVSDDDIPTGIWYTYRTNAVVTVTGVTYWWDYPGFGYDEQAYYVTGNLFGLSEIGWAGVGFRVFDKGPLLAGQPAQFTTLRDGLAASCQVAQHFGQTVTPYFVSAKPTSQLRIHAILDPLAASPVLLSTLVDVSAFGIVTNPAPNVGGNLDVIDERVFNAVWRTGNLFTTQHIPMNGRNIVRWYQLRTNTWPASGSITLVQSGDIDVDVGVGSGIHSFFPAIYTNRCEDAAVVMATSAATTTPEIRVTGRWATDAPGSMAMATIEKFSPSGAAGPWGDYFDLALDPVDDTTFWFVGEYQKDATHWGTWIGSLTISCPADLNCDRFVDGIDYDAFNNAWEAGDPSADFNHDGFVDGIDYDAFNAAFESGCP